MEKQYVYRQYVNREDDFFYAPYDPELSFYDAICSGEKRRLEGLFDIPLHEKEGLGLLSKNDLQSLKYHFAISTALVARHCMEAGMDLPTAFKLSDYYIQRADVAKSKDEISKLHESMGRQYWAIMHDLGTKKITSLPIIKTVDYICDHLHTRITLEKLAENVGLSQAYLSKLFLKETGESITSFINRKKLQTAENMLLYSEYNPAQIANILSFCSQSYFTEQFKKKNGITPREYQKKYYRS